MNPQKEFVFMEREKKKALREQFDQRKPDMGIVCWQSGEKMWIAISTDAKADYNGTLFQKKLDYKERDEDHGDDLELLFLMCMEEYPEAKQMRPGRR